MCYSAQIWADYRRYVRDFGAVLGIEEFVDLFWRRVGDASIKIPRGMEAVFDQPATDDERLIKLAIDEFSVAQVAKTEDELAAQLKRLAKAEHALLTKPTKAAADSKRVATNKIEAGRARLEDLARPSTDEREDDGRVFPLQYAPVMVARAGQRVILPMRYQCRLAGKPASYDREYPGTYNARRDNLEGFWRKQFGYTHGLMVVSKFYENVKRHRLERRGLGEGERESNVVLLFAPKPARDMLVACLWSRWTAPGQHDLLSFAIVADDPPPEISIAGHDRCIVPIRPENVDAWLNPDARDLKTQYAILDERDSPYYDYRVAA